jgi:hypothetical protein
MEFNLQKKRLIRKLRQKRRMSMSKRTVTFIRKSKNSKSKVSSRPAPKRICGRCSRKARIKSA